MAEVNNFERLRNAAALSDYIGRTVDLHKAGPGKWRGPCSLHGSGNDSTLSVDDGLGVWHCFGCGESGDVTAWHMKSNNIQDFTEALETLGAALGVTIERSSGGKAAEQVSLKRLREAAAALADAAADHLAKDSSTTAQAVNDYLDERGVDGPLMDEWLLGAIPTGRRGVDFVRSAVDGDMAAAYELGLLARSSRDESTYVPLSGRVLMPVRDRSGVVVGFGGRVLPGEGASGNKYLNTPASRLYNKSAVLYGEHLLGPVKKPTGSAKTEPGDAEAVKRAVVVEGHFDVIGANHAGAGVALATCGTALTSQHVESLRQIPQVVFAFDGDDAGRRAMLKSTWVANRMGGRALGLALPEDVDPFELAQDDPRTLRQLIDRAEPLLSAVVRVTRVLHPEDADFDDAVAGLMSAVVAGPERDGLMREAARIRGVSASGYSRNLALASPAAAKTAQMATAADKRGAAPGADSHAGPSAVDDLDPNMRVLLRRMMEEQDAVSSAALASLTSLLRMREDDPSRQRDHEDDRDADRSGSHSDHDLDEDGAAYGDGLDDDDRDLDGDEEDRSSDRRDVEGHSYLDRTDSGLRGASLARASMRTALPITGDLDMVTLELLAQGRSGSAGTQALSSAATQALSALMPDYSKTHHTPSRTRVPAARRAPGSHAAGDHDTRSDGGEEQRHLDSADEREDLRPMLRAAFSLLHLEARQLCADARTPAVLRRQLLRLRAAEAASRELDQQVSVLAWLIDLSIDVTAAREAFGRA